MCHYFAELYGGNMHGTEGELTMARKRVVLLSGSIGDEVVRNIEATLLRMDTLSAEQVKLLISSSGGGLESALHLHEFHWPDAIRNYCCCRWAVFLICCGYTAGLQTQADDDERVFGPAQWHYHSDISLWLSGLDESRFASSSGD
jgi:hypothetical protein